MALASATPRSELFRVLGDDQRLRVLALCAADELTVGELATLTDESQPQITKKSQPLRDASLVAARRDGARTLLSTIPTDDPVVRAALEEGRALCTKDGSLSRVAKIIAQREDGSRRYFAEARDASPIVVDGAQLLPYLPLIAPLIPHRALALDVGTGEGALLPILSPLFERVIAIDPSPARLARCAERIDGLGLTNVRLLEGEVSDTAVVQEMADRGGADLVVLARVLHHVARPAEVIAHAVRLMKRHAHLAIIEHLPHDDEGARHMGAVWLGFEPARLSAWLKDAGLDVVAQMPLDSRTATHEQLVVAKRT